jgi:DNA-binding transcriptional regulator YiaG
MFGKDNKLASIADAVKQVVEASPVKIPTTSGTKVLGTRYGNSAKAHKDQIADPFAGQKGPGKKDLEAIEKPVKEELKGDQEKIDANHNDKIDSQDFKILRGKKKVKEDTFAGKLLNSLSESEAIQKEINEVMKKDATAGDWIHDFVHSDNPKFSGKSKAERKKMALGAYYAKQNEEIVPKQQEPEETPARKTIKAKETEAKRDGEVQKVDKFDAKYGKPNPFKEEHVAEAKVGDDVVNKKEKMDALKPPAKPGPLHNVGKGFKAFLQGKKEPMESVEVEGEVLDEKLDPKKKTVDTLAGRVKVPADANTDNQHFSAKVELNSEAKTPEQDDVPFEPPYTKTTGTVTDKSGAKHNPMSRARDLAKTALKRVQSDLKVK